MNLYELFERLYICMIHYGSSIKLKVAFDDIDIIAPDSYFNKLLKQMVYKMQFVLNRDQLLRDV